MNLPAHRRRRIPRLPGVVSGGRRDSGIARAGAQAHVPGLGPAAARRRRALQRLGRVESVDAGRHAGVGRAASARSTRPSGSSTTSGVASAIHRASAPHGLWHFDKAAAYARALDRRAALAVRRAREAHRRRGSHDDPSGAADEARGLRAGARLTRWPGPAGPVKCARMTRERCTGHRPRGAGPRRGHAAPGARAPEPGRAGRHAVLGRSGRRLGPLRRRGAALDLGLRRPARRIPRLGGALRGADAGSSIRRPSCAGTPTSTTSCTSTHAGVPVVPTLFVEPGADCAAELVPFPRRRVRGLHASAAAVRSSSSSSSRPIGAGSRDAARYRREEQAAGRGARRTPARRPGAASCCSPTSTAWTTTARLPWSTSGAATATRSARDRCCGSTTGSCPGYSPPSRSRPGSPTTDERRVAEAAFRACSLDEPLYARMDLIHDDRGRAGGARTRTHRAVAVLPARAGGRRTVRGRAARGLNRSLPVACRTRRPQSISAGRHHDSRSHAAWTR